MKTTARGRLGFVLANIGVMVILHGNDRQFWPRIPYLSLRDESEAEHTRLLRNTLAVVTIGQLALRRLPSARWLPRIVAVAVVPVALAPLLRLNERVLKLRGPAEGMFHLGIVAGLPLGVSFVEDALMTLLES